MRKNKTLLSLLLSLALLLVTAAPALAFPPLPSGFFGRVTLNGVDVPVGTDVQALINGVVYATAETGLYNGHASYSLLVPGDDDSTPGVIEGGKSGDQVTFRVAGLTATQTATWRSGTNAELTLSAAGTPNQSPQAVNDTYTMNEDSLLQIAAPGLLVNDSDANNDALTAAIFSGPEHGTLNLQTTGAFTYQPRPNFNGMVTFTYRATDGKGEDTATVTISVRPVNDPPLVKSGAVETQLNRPLAIPMGSYASDVETAAANLRYVIDKAPQNGTLSGTAPALVYTPRKDFSGKDSFTFHVEDRGDPDSCTGPATACAVKMSSTTAVITITVLNPDPVIQLYKIMVPMVRKP